MAAFVQGSHPGGRLALPQWVHSACYQHAGTLPLPFKIEHLLYSEPNALCVIFLNPHWVRFSPCYK